MTTMAEAQKAMRSSLLDCCFRHGAPATMRNVSATASLADLISVVARDDLFDAIFDTGEDGR